MQIREHGSHRDRSALFARTFQLLRTIKPQTNYENIIAKTFSTRILKYPHIIYT